MNTITSQEKIIVEAKKFNVHPNIHDNDFLWQYLTKVIPNPAENYFSDGFISATRIKDIVLNFFKNENKAISFLDFASGYGMVARHFKNVFPEYVTYATCDIHPEANAFNAEHLKIKTYQSDSFPTNLRLNDTFDVIFCLSFFSHISGDYFVDWLANIYSHIKEGGLMVFTTHGRFSRLEVKMEDDIIYFKPVSEQSDLNSNLYGMSWAGSGYVIKALKQIDPRGAAFTRVIRFSEAEWWDHQDLYVIAKL